MIVIRCNKCRAEISLGTVAADGDHDRATSFLTVTQSPAYLANRPRCIASGDLCRPCFLSVAEFAGLTVEQS